MSLVITVVIGISSIIYRYRNVFINVFSNVFMFLHLAHITFFTRIFSCSCIFLLLCIFFIFITCHLNIEFIPRLHHQKHVFFCLFLHLSVSHIVKGFYLQCLLSFISLFPFRFFTVSNHSCFIGTQFCLFLVRMCFIPFLPFYSYVLSFVSIYSRYLSRVNHSLPFSFLLPLTIPLLSSSHL